jgi:SAM-dependent methyltransferase
MGFPLMERVIYEQMAELDEVHWWYVARRKVLRSLIERRVPLPANARILEVGCGTGHNLEMLQQFGKVDAVELDAGARAIAEKRLGRKVASARLPELRGIERGAYDLVAALDVVEHIQDDEATVAALASCLRPGGKLLVTVPAHQWMWSKHDELNHHKRRYSKRGLRRLIERSPLRVESIGYFNSVLFPLAVAARLVSKATGKSGGEESLPPKPVNYLFERAFAAERRLVGAVPLPPGLSLFAVASAT